MGLITLDEAAARLGVPRETVEEWCRSGLLTPRPGPASPPTEPCVEEEELAAVGESLGWLELSGGGWDSAERLGQETPISSPRDSAR